MTSIRDQFSAIMGIRLQNDNWIGYIQMLERDAHFNNVHRNKLLVVLGQAVEQLQSQNEFLKISLEAMGDRIKHLEEVKITHSPASQVVDGKKDAPPSSKGRNTAHPVQSAKK